MSTYIPSDEPVGPKPGTWVWLPLTPESNLITDFISTAHSFPAPAEAADSSAWPSPDAPLFDPYPSPVIDATLLDHSLGMDVGDLGSLADVDLFSPQAVGADYAWMSQSTETADLLELDPCLAAEIDRQVADLTWEELVSAPQMPDDLAALGFDITTTSTYAPITPPSSASGPSPAASSPSPSPRVGTTATAAATYAYTCSEPSCTQSFPTPHQLRKHERKHTRPFVCSACHKGHAAKKDLHRHLWVRHPEVAERSGIPCEVRRCRVPGCDFEGRQDNLKRHMRTKHR